MQHTFTPEVCKDQPAVPGADGAPETPARPARYSGTVTLKMPTYDERLEIAEEIGVEGLAEDGAVKVSKLKLARMLGKRAGRHVVGVDLVRKADNYPIKDWETLQYETDLSPVIVEIGSMLIGRFAVGGLPLSAS